MPLSARRGRHRRVRASAVGLPTRVGSSLVDSILPSIALYIMIRADALSLDVFRSRRGIFVEDQFLMRLYEHPQSVLSLPLTWMLLWTAFSLVTLGTVRTSPGKRLTGLALRDARGRRPSGFRLLLRIFASWLVPATLGLAYLWIAISPQRRGWHDTISGTFMVRDHPEPVASTLPRRKPRPERGDKGGHSGGTDPPAAYFGRSAGEPSDSGATHGDLSQGADLQ